MTTTTPPLRDLTVDVVTPYASWSRRVVAALLDTAVLSAVAWLLTGQTMAPPLQPGFGEVASAVTGRAWWLVVGAWAAMLVLQGLTGQTPGRRVMDIHVVRAPVGGPVGGAPGVLRSFGRWFAHLVDGVLLIGYLRPLWHAERRTFADSMADTVVLRLPPPAPRDGRGAAITTAAFVICLVSAVGAFGGESGGIRTDASSPCALTSQEPGAPLVVEAVTLVRVTEWTREQRLLPTLAPVHRVERERYALEVEWRTTSALDPTAALVIETDTDGGTTENDVPEVGSREPFETVRLEGVGSRPVDVTVRLDGRHLTSCTVDVP